MVGQIDDPVQLFAFGTAVLISAIVFLYHLLARFKQNGVDRSIVLPVVFGFFLAFFAGLSALHNKTNESMPWLFSSEAIDRGVFEWFTVIFLFGACWASFTLFRKTIGIQRMIFGLLACASFLIAMEELSWGQWIFKWGTPENLAKVNLQQETNIHNLVNPRIYDLVYYAIGYATLALALIAMFMFGKKNAASRNSGKGLTGLFSSGGSWLRRSQLGLLITLAAASFMQHELLEEYAECVMALGIMMFLFYHKDRVTGPGPSV